MSAAGLKLLQKIWRSKHLGSPSPQDDAQQRPARLPLQLSESIFKLIKSAARPLPATDLKNKSRIEILIWWLFCKHATNNINYYK